MSHEQIQKLLLDVSLVTKSAVKSQQHDFSFKKKKKRRRKKERKKKHLQCIILITNVRETQKIVPTGGVCVVKPGQTFWCLMN